MPIGHPERFISVRAPDGQGAENEIGLIRDLREWSADEQALVRESLLRRYFVHVITDVFGIELLGNHLTLEVGTDVGTMEFTMRWQPDRAEEYGERGRMFIDTEENRYLLRDTAELGPRARTLLEKYIYW
jgi:hypothetical protein